MLILVDEPELVLFQRTNFFNILYNVLTYETYGCVRSDPKYQQRP